MLAKVINLKLRDQFQPWPESKKSELRDFLLQGLLVHGYSPDDDKIKDADWDAYISVLKKVVADDPLPAPSHTDPF